MLALVHLVIITSLIGIISLGLINPYNLSITQAQLNQKMAAIQAHRFSLGKTVCLPPKLACNKRGILTCLPAWCDGPSYTIFSVIAVFQTLEKGLF